MVLAYLVDSSFRIGQFMKSTLSPSGCFCADPPLISGQQATSTILSFLRDTLSQFWMQYGWHSNSLTTGGYLTYGNMFNKICCVQLATPRLLTNPLSLHSSSSFHTSITDGYLISTCSSFSTGSPSCTYLGGGGGGYEQFSITKSKYSSFMSMQAMLLLSRAARMSFSTLVEQQILQLMKMLSRGNACMNWSGIFSPSQSSACFLFQKTSRNASPRACYCTAGDGLMLKCVYPALAAFRMWSFRLKLLSFGLKFIVPRAISGIDLPSDRITFGFESILFLRTWLLLSAKIRTDLLTQHSKIRSVIQASQICFREQLINPIYQSNIGGIIDLYYNKGMSIVLKSNQLNLIIYKYLLESGLQHAAFTLFNQASLSETATQYKFDVKSGHLLNLLQKSLVFTQIQQHMNFSEYMQCQQPFHLLKRHTCTIVEKAKEDRQLFIRQLNNNIMDSMRRTNTIYTTQLSNKEYDEIVYEPRESYLQKCPKIKLNKQTDYSATFDVSGANDSSRLVLTDNDSKSLTILKYDPENIHSIQVQAIYPTVIDNQFRPVIMAVLSPSSHSSSDQFLVEVYEGNQVNLRKLKDFTEENGGSQGNRHGNAAVQLSSFQIQLFSGDINAVQFNENFPFLIAFSKVNPVSPEGSGSPNMLSEEKINPLLESEYCVINARNMKSVLNGKGLFLWRFYSQYILYERHEDEERLVLKSLKGSEGKEGTLLEFKLQEPKAVKSLAISPPKNYLSVLSTSNKIYIYTFDNPEPLYTIIEPETVKIGRVMWSNSKEVDYLTYHTDQYIKLWEVELSQFSKKIDTKDYDTQIRDILSVRKNQEESFIVGLGSDNLLVYDINLAKIERIQLPESATNNMKSINHQVMSVWNQTCLYFLTSQHLEALFL